MVKLNDSGEQRRDSAFRALADSTRRSILEQLSEGEASVSDLAQPRDVSLAAISKHVGVLADAGLVVREKRGRTTYCRLDPEPLRAAHGWLAALEAEWINRFSQLADLLDSPPE